MDTQTQLAPTAANAKLVSEFLIDVLECANKTKTTTKEPEPDPEPAKDVFEFPDILNDTIKIGGKEIPIVYAAGGAIILLFIASKIKL